MKLFIRSYKLQMGDKMEEKNRYDWIDALRGYGALGVLLCHLIQRLQFENMITLNNITSYFLNGARAVQMFYIITGLVTFLSLSRCKWGGVLFIYKKEIF